MDTTRRSRRARARRADISLMVIGAIWIAGLWLISAETREVKSTWVVTEARIVDAKAETDTKTDRNGQVRSSVVYYTNFAFLFDGLEREGTTQDSVDRSGDIGQTMSVWVNPKSPANFRHELSEEPPAALYGIGALLFAVGLALRLRKAFVAFREGADA